MEPFDPFVDALVFCREIRRGPDGTDLIGLVDTYFVDAAGAKGFQFRALLYLNIRHSGHERDWPLTVRIRIPGGETFDIKTLPFRLGEDRRAYDADVELLFNAEQFGEHVLSLVSAEGSEVARTMFLVEPAPAEAPGLH